MGKTFVICACHDPCKDNVNHNLAEGLRFAVWLLTSVADPKKEI